MNEPKVSEENELASSASEPVLSTDTPVEITEQASEPADALKDMFKTGAHFGYSRSSRHPKMKAFLFGLRNNIEVFDLEKTTKKLDEAKEFAKELGKSKKTILFAGTKSEIKELVKKYAEEINMPYVLERWLGGTLTNFSELKKRREHMQDLMQKKESGELAKYTKKEQLMIEKKVSKLKRYFSGVENMDSMVSALIVVDTKQEKIAVTEAKKMSIPVIGIMNSDCNPEDAKYPIPANDNSVASVEYFLKDLTKSYREGLKEAVDEEEKAALVGEALASEAATDEATTDETLAGEESKQENKTEVETKDKE